MILREWKKAARSGKRGYSSHVDAANCIYMIDLSLTRETTTRSPDIDIDKEDQSIKECSVSLYA